MTGNTLTYPHYRGKTGVELQLAGERIRRVSAILLAENDGSGRGRVEAEQLLDEIRDTVVGIDAFIEVIHMVADFIHHDVHPDYWEDGLDLDADHLRQLSKELIACRNDLEGAFGIPTDAAPSEEERPDGDDGRDGGVRRHMHHEAGGPRRRHVRGGDEAGGPWLREPGRRDHGFRERRRLLARAHLLRDARRDAEGRGGVPPSGPRALRPFVQ